MEVQGLLTFTMEREYQNYYSEFNQEQTDGRPSAVGALYVQKWALGTDLPKELVVTITAPGSGEPGSLGTSFHSELRKQLIRHSSMAWLVHQKGKLRRSFWRPLPPTVAVLVKNYGRCGLSTLRAIIGRRCKCLGLFTTFSPNSDTVRCSTGYPGHHTGRNERGRPFVP